MLYMMPKERSRNAFYVSGAWQASEQHLTYQGQTEAIIRVPYEAVEVNAVLTPYAEMIDRIVHPEPVSVEVWQDDKPLDATIMGDDLTADGRVVVDRPRMYNLVRNKGFVGVALQFYGFFSSAFNVLLDNAQTMAEAPSKAAKARAAT